MTVPWTAGMCLRCPACGASEPPGPAWYGCRCGDAPLAVAYDGGVPRTPIATEARTDLGLKPTPLVDGPAGVLLKLELRNPTGSHKDRFHAITSAIARLSDAPGVVTWSTGNHGVACAAHAARDGLGCVVLSTSQLPRALEAQIGSYGATVGWLSGTECRRALEALVAEGWHPATASDPALAGAGNPYGVEAYRDVARELVEKLGRLPSLVAVPAASGDTALAILAELRELGRAYGERAVVVAAQPAGASSLRASLEAGRMVELDHPRSIARSTSDPATGRLAIRAFGRAGASVSVPDDRIEAATRTLASAGHYVETSSALSYAAIEIAREEGLAAEEGSAVAVLTASGRGWNDEDPRFAPPVAATSARELLAAARKRVSAG